MITYSEFGFNYKDTFYLYSKIESITSLYSRRCNYYCFGNTFKNFRIYFSIRMVSGAVVYICFFDEEIKTPNTGNFLNKLFFKKRTEKTQKDFETQQEKIIKQFNEQILVAEEVYTFFEKQFMKFNKKCLGN